MEQIDILIFCLSIVLIVILLSLGKKYENDKNDDGKENYRRGWGWGRPWWRRRRFWNFW